MQVLQLGKCKKVGFHEWDHESFEHDRKIAVTLRQRSAVCMAIATG